jgi:hypothetical protein
MGNEKIFEKSVDSLRSDRRFLEKKNPCGVDAAGIHNIFNF